MLTWNTVCAPTVYSLMHVLVRASQQSTCIHKMLKLLESFRRPLAGVDVLRMVGSHKLCLTGCINNGQSIPQLSSEPNGNYEDDEDEAGSCNQP